ncbi:hypothetical protein [Rhodococcus koreensis]|uniref:Transcriptional regulator, AbiEi antitoxin, Type IV TA system n=1 Tax=Rhodococcus koreensis TaxID=99653 RepID=A0A1H4RTG9_9NOCA|nr:hypothetical protein [Rhodococcus koreensis]SEC34911.1 Transcriptional regulator, AbiEi antitoxin, Type IV TA system [Rhodococcus koreensis]
MEHDPGAMLRRQEALGRGYSDDEIRRLYTRGEWQRIGRGAYLSAAVCSALGDEERHRFLIDSTLHALSDDAVLSHQSAAVVYGLPLWRTALDRVHVTRNRRGGGRVKRRITVHCAPIGDRVAVVDAELALAARRHGIDAARRVVHFVSGHSESVGESRSRVMLARAGLAVPSQQGEVFDPGGRRVGRVDFHFDGIVLGEFDGRVKYGRLLKPGQSPGDAVFAEKQREDALRDLGYQVVRWTWDDLESPSQAVDRVRRAIARAESPRGWVVQAPLPSAQPLTVRSL